MQKLQHSLLSEMQMKQENLILLQKVLNWFCALFHVHFDNLIKCKKQKKNMLKSMQKKPMPSTKWKTNVDKKKKQKGTAR